MKIGKNLTLVLICIFFGACGGSKIASSTGASEKEIRERTPMMLADNLRGIPGVDAVPEKTYKLG